MFGGVEKEPLPMILAMSKLRGCPDRHVATQTLACKIPAVGDSPIMSESWAPHTKGKKWCACWALKRTEMAFQSLSPSGRRLEISFSCCTRSSEKKVSSVAGVTVEGWESWMPLPIASEHGLWFETPQLGNKALLTRCLDVKSDETLVADGPFFKVSLDSLGAFLHFSLKQNPREDPQKHHVRLQESPTCALS